MGTISIDGYEPAHLSHSTVNGYRMCGKKFQLEKVFQLEQKPGLAAIGGNAVHTATEKLDLAGFFGEGVDNRSTDAKDSENDNNPGE